MQIPSCPFVGCAFDPVLAIPAHSVRFGRFYRRSDRAWVRRYRCLRCRRTYSSSTRSPNFRQKKRQVNRELSVLFTSGVSQTRAAVIAGVNPKTAVRKFRFLAEQARIQHRDWQQTFSAREKFMDVQFDDLETSEHSKCKPLSVALAVDVKTRKILSFQVSRMPAKGLLAGIACKKYGRRRDERSVGWNSLFRELREMVDSKATFTSDENPHYPKHLRRFFKEATHCREKSRKACVAGQGELKKIGFDPLFSLNHTCAMLRANLNRLFRRTWCTTKTIQGLVDHLSIYVRYHNEVLTPSRSTG